MFHCAGIFQRDSFVVSLVGIYLDNSTESGTGSITGLLREAVGMPAKAWRNAID